MFGYKILFETTRIEKSARNNSQTFSRKSVLNPGLLIQLEYATNYSCKYMHCYWSSNPSAVCKPTRKFYLIACFFMARQLSVGQGLLFHEVSRPHTEGRTPLDEWSARRRDLYLITYNNHNRQTSMNPVGFETTNSAGEQPQTYGQRS